MQKILILTTGGTIDKVYFDAKSTYEVGPPNIGSVLAELKIAIDYRILSLMRKDSLELTTTDREQIKQAILAADEQQILITHGTDTMVKTGWYLQGLSERTIVLTGALQPALFKTSDALFNIGCGLTAVQVMKPGCYITMNGLVFDCRQVQKNHNTGIFERPDRVSDGP